ncbi:MAG: hypothetical protein HY716_05615 [Planctomycetes bacterium]|nr:hypothetical protein [Planctomycetota bacterium]
MNQPEGWDRLRPDVRDRVRPFITDVAGALGEHLVGAAVTGKAALQGPDFDAGRIETILVCDELSVRHVEIVAPMGKKHGKKGLAAPLILSATYIEESKDVFPLEFFNIKLIRATVHGRDVFADLDIAPEDLRRQCEREIRTFLIRLRQGYLSSAGEGRALEEVVREASVNFGAIVRGVLHLLRADIALDEEKDARALRERLNLAAQPVHARMLLGDVRAHPRENFEKFYAFAHELSGHVNDLKPT